MNTERAIAILAALEAEHGPGVLAALLGAAFREEQRDEYEDETAGWRDEHPTFESHMASDQTAEFSYEWCAEFCNTPEFCKAAGLR